MQLSNDRQVNEKSFKIGMNSQNFARFDPLSWEKIGETFDPALAVIASDATAKNVQRQKIDDLGKDILAGIHGLSPRPKSPAEVPDT
jgi:hypothetical protein